MFYRRHILWLVLAAVIAGAPRILAQEDENPVVYMQTNYGTIEITLDRENAPRTVGNFLRYVEEGFYDGTIFHRVIPGFMIQGGGFTEDLKPRKTHPPIRNEADNGLKNERGTIAMARTLEINSATSQFFINLVDNEALDKSGIGPRDFGYAVFGYVTNGMQVVDEIAAVPTANAGQQFANLPTQPVVIEWVMKKN